MTSLSTRRGRILGIASIAVGLLLVACLGNAAADSIGIGSPKALTGPKTQQASPTTPRSGKTPAVVAVSPVNLAVGVRPDAPITVRASSGTLGAVKLMDSKGDQVQGLSLIHISEPTR